MKALSVPQINKLVQELKTLEGSRLQQVQLSGSLFMLGFYVSRLRWLVFDMNSSAPQILLLDTLSDLKLKFEKKPIVLFATAHIQGHRLMQISSPVEFGRVIILQFQGQPGAQVEVRLFPRGQNILLRSGEKEIALSKPQPLKINIEDHGSEFKDQNEELLSLEEVTSTWLRERLGSNSSKVAFENETKTRESSGRVATPEQKEILKLEKVLKKIELELESKNQQQWTEVGQWLKEHQTLAVPDNFKKFIDPKLSFSENLEKCFVKGKNLKIKLQRTIARRDEILDKINSIRAGRWQPSQPRASLLKAAEVKGRTIDLQNGMLLYVGKSAEDNLRLLRQARPWYYWLHLRDEPSAHAILHRQKSYMPTEQDLHHASRELIRITYGSKHEERDNEKFEIIVTECRFVKPLKGEKKGRVTFSNERTFTHVYHSNH